MSTTVLEQPRLTPRSALRYRPTTEKQNSTQPVSKPARAERAKWEAHTTGGLPSAMPVRSPFDRKLRLHWILVLTGAMVATMLLLCLIQFVSARIAIISDDLHYGRPRTFQTDAFVGHEQGKTPSHFVAMNLNGRAYILEIPGGDASKTKMLVGPQLSGAQSDLAPITLDFVPGTEKGQQDMLVHFGDFEIRYVNTQGTFVQRQS